MKQTKVFELNTKVKTGVFSKILPFLVFLSFVWLNFYTTTADLNVLNINFTIFDTIESYVFFSVLFAGLLDYVLFEFIFFIYKFILGFSIYSFLIPRQVLNNRFRLWFMIRNIVLGVVYNLRFFFPYITVYLVVVEVILNMSILICLYYDIKKDYIEPLVGQFVFKTLSIPFILYEVYIVITMMVGVL